MTALRITAWISVAVSLIGIVGVVLSDFCANGSLAEFAWIYGGLFALVLLIGLALATDNQRERTIAVVVAVSGTSLGAIVGALSGFAHIYPGGC